MKKAFTKAEFRRFLLARQGLVGRRRFRGEEGALAFIRQAGCIQFDPIDVCGRNAELTLFSRVAGFKKQQLDYLLYKKRLLFEYPDKELSIIPREDWPHFARWRGTSERNLSAFPEAAALCEDAERFIRENGAASSSELPIKGRVRWNSAVHWSGNWHGETNAARAVLEQLYTQGRLVIHHREGSRKFYDLAERCLGGGIAAQPDPCPELADHIKWGVLRRIGAIGALWDRRSDSLLGIWGMDTQLRRRAFGELCGEGLITPVSVEGVSAPLYVKTEDLPALEEAGGASPDKRRCEPLAPLDPFMWDRKLIEEVFGFRYRWEVYTPKEKREFGYYVLPLVCGDGFVGRAEAKRAGEVLRVRIWYEPGTRRSKSLEDAVRAAMERLARFNGCEKCVYEDGEQGLSAPSKA